MWELLGLNFYYLLLKLLSDFEIRITWHMWGNICTVYPKERKQKEIITNDYYFDTRLSCSGENVDEGQKRKKEELERAGRGPRESKKRSTRGQEEEH